uniref:Phorbol-ester/DAG-type domain-containing protein n=1 Tax=Rhodnius prolixus TaxID=13249 RepID=T1I8E9_RHOPR
MDIIYTDFRNAFGEAELLTQLRKEPCFTELKQRLLNSPTFLPKGVPYPYPSKLVPMLRYNGANVGNNIEKEKKIGFIKYNRKEAIIQIPKGIQQSLLKIKGGKTPNKKDLEGQQIIDDENSQTKSDLFATSPSSTTNGDNKVIKTSPSRSSSHSDESEVNDLERSIMSRKIKLVKKYDTRFLRKKKYSALLPTGIKKSTLKTDVENKDKVDGDSSGSEANEVKPLRPEDLGQELFLSYFVSAIDCFVTVCLFSGLVSKAKGDVLKRKRCERKRRSVAGQSSLYSDYYQPSKRSYAKKAPSSTPTSPTNQVIVETAAVELDDEDEKPKYCTVCSETGVMESCQSCSGTYHEKCKPNISNGCPNCSLQATDINSIVGANFFGSPSSYEIIKRYSVTGIDASETNLEDKGQKPTESKEIMV